MVEKRNCSFCGEPIEPGTGKIYVKKDGTVYNFCTNKCKKNRIDIGRVPRRTKWTVRYNELKAGSLSREQAAREAAEAEEKSEKKATTPKKTNNPSQKKETTPSKKPAAKPAKAPKSK